MKNNNLSSMPMQFVRDSVEQSLSEGQQHMSLDDIIKNSLNVLGISEESSDAYMIFEDILSSMVAKNKIVYKDDKYALNVRNSKQTVIPENEPAVIQLPKNYTVKHINGENIIFSIGSDYYPMAWSSIEDNEGVKVSLVPEPENKYDSKAVAICVNDIIVGHLDRMMARRFQPTLLELYKKKIVLTFDAMAQTSEQRNGYRFLSIGVPLPETISEKFKIKL